MNVDNKPIRLDLIMLAKIQQLLVDQIVEDY